MSSQHSKIRCLVLAHIIIICLSNTLVQYPFVLGGFKTTWGAFSYPLIFILTDLSTRLSGPKQARKIVLWAMLPGLICSYLISNYNQGNLLLFNILALRIALASFCAYLLGQLLDIYLFQRLKRYLRWWVAPSISTTFANILDTYCFFAIAFYHSTNLFLSTHWIEIATVDLAVKLIFSVITVIPLYGIILRLIISKNKRPDLTILATSDLILGSESDSA